jgi:hypothetical protein
MKEAMVIKHHSLDMGEFLQNDPFKRKEYKYAFQKDSNSSLLNKTLVKP